MLILNVLFVRHAPPNPDISEGGNGTDGREARRGGMGQAQGPGLRQVQAFGEKPELPSREAAEYVASLLERLRGDGPAN
jgi:hypothetical protein